MSLLKALRKQTARDLRGFLATASQAANFILASVSCLQAGVAGALGAVFVGFSWELHLQFFGIS